MLAPMNKDFSFCTICDACLLRSLMINSYPGSSEPLNCAAFRYVTAKVRCSPEEIRCSRPSSQQRAGGTVPITAFRRLTSGDLCSRRSWQRPIHFDGGWRVIGKVLWWVGLPHGAGSSSALSKKDLNIKKTNGEGSLKRGAGSMVEAKQTPCREL
jgi:hypothetical protein